MGEESVPSLVKELCKHFHRKDLGKSFKDSIYGQNEETNIQLLKKTAFTVLFSQLEGPLEL